MSANKLVCLAMPFRNSGGIDTKALMRGTIAGAAQKGNLDIAPIVSWSSLLTYTFNTLWSFMLNNRKGVGVTSGGEAEVVKPMSYFAMIHDDIKPEDGWLDTLVEELEANDADMVSAVVPIKDHLGLTSTAVDSTGDNWNPRRLTLTEVFELPETFGDKDVGGPLLLNTGLWVIRTDRDWTDKLIFRQQDEMRINGDGHWEAHTKPEDWDFSRQVHSHGGKLMATRKVQLVHEREQWHNRMPWGKWKTDELLSVRSGENRSSVA